jgi:DNA-binding NtrC family response regulator
MDSGQEKCLSTILVVEDEETVRALVVLVLEQAGYRVLQAGNAHGATIIWDMEAQTIDLLISDINLPGTSGIALAAKFQKQRPDLKVLFVSGHDNSHAPALVQSSKFLPKPYTPKKLISASRTAIGEIQRQRRNTANTGECSMWSLMQTTIVCTEIAWRSRLRDALEAGKEVDLINFQADCDGDGLHELARKHRMVFDDLKFGMFRRDGPVPHFGG